MKISIYPQSIVTLLVMIGIFEPWYIMTYTGYDFLFDILKVVMLVVLFMTILIRGYSVEPVYYLIALLYMSIMMGNLVNGTNVLNALKEAVKAGLMLMLYTYIFAEEDEDCVAHSLRVMSLFMMVIFTINSITMYFPLPDVPRALSDTYLFLGSDNGSTPLYMLGALISYIYGYYYGGKSFFWYTMFNYMLFALHQEVGTAVVTGVIIIAFALAKPMIPADFKVRLGRLSAFSLILWAIIYTTSLGFISNIIDTLLYGKYRNIIDRIMLWNLFAVRLPRSPLFGFGASNAEDLTLQRGSFDKWISQHNTHNTFLEILYNGGFVAFILLILIVFLSAYRFDRESDDRRDMMIAVIIFTYLVRGLVECGAYYLFFMLPFVLCISRIDKQRKEEQMGLVIRIGAEDRNGSTG